MRRLAAGDLTPEEEEELRKRLAAIAQECIQLQLEALELEAAELQRRLAGGTLTHHTADALVRWRRDGV